VGLNDRLAGGRLAGVFDAICDDEASRGEGAPDEPESTVGGAEPSLPSVGTGIETFGGSALFWSPFCAPGAVASPCKEAVTCPSAGDFDQFVSLPGLDLGFLVIET
jgi:hypothetical protein